MMMMKLKMTEHFIKCENVTTCIDDVLKEECDKSIVDIETIHVSNFCETSKKK